MNEKRWVGIKLIYPNSTQDVNPSDPGIVSKFGASSHADRISEHVRARTRREPWVADSIAASFCIGRAACGWWTFMPVSTCTGDQNGDVWMSMHWCCQQMRQTHDSGHRMWRKSGLAWFYDLQEVEVIGGDPLLISIWCTPESPVLGKYRD